MDLYTLGWVAWLAYFGVLEGLALANTRKGDTFSEKVWAWASVKDKGTAWRARRFALLAGVAWLSAHFLSGGSW